MAVLVFGFPAPGALVVSGDSFERVVPQTRVDLPIAVAADPAVSSIEAFLKTYRVDPSHRNRVAKSVVRSAKKHDLDPRLIASIIIVESRANPFAISGKDSIGMMQIHLPTWGRKADQEGVNLFKIEDNVDFGARILKDYIRQSGLWLGVQRYNGLSANPPESAVPVEGPGYVEKVQRIYGLQEPITSTAELLH